MIQFDHGKVFASNAVFAGYIFLVVGVLALFIFLHPIGILLILGALFILFTRRGVQIDMDQLAFREYTMLFGLVEVGSWKELKGYTYITVMPSSSSSTSYSRSGRMNTETDYYQSVYIFKPRLRGKVELVRCRNYDTAIQKSREIEQQLTLEFFEYSPVTARKIMGEA